MTGSDAPSNAPYTPKELEEIHGRLVTLVAEKEARENPQKIPFECPLCGSTEYYEINPPFTMDTVIGCKQPVIGYGCNGCTIRLANPVEFQKALAWFTTLRHNALAAVESGPALPDRDRD